MHVLELCPLLYHLPAADDIVHFLSAKLVGKNLIASGDNRPDPVLKQGEARRLSFAYLGQPSW